MNVFIFRCSEAPRPGLSACNCFDCKESCSAQALSPPVIPDIPEPFHIFKRDGPTVVATLAFIFSQQSFPVSDCTSSPTGVNLGSLEEIEPLRSKKVDRRRMSQKVLSKPSRFQRLGRWLERHLETQFMSWGLFVSQKPITIMILSLFVCSAFSFGLFLNFDVTTNPVDLWVSPGSEARKDMEDYNKYFGKPRVKNISWGPVFQQEFLLAALDLQLQVENLTATVDNSTIHLTDICLSPLKPLNTACAIQSIFGFFQNKAERFQNKNDYLLHFKSCSLAPKDSKCFAPFGGPLDSAAVVLGGFNNSFDSAQALVITIPVTNYNDADLTLKARIWESKFLQFIQNYSHPLMKIAFKAERSIQDEIERGSHSDLLTVAISYMLMFCYITVSLGEYHECKTLLVESKFTLGFFGVLIVLVSVISSLGLFSFLGVPATLIIVEVVPFLVLAVGVDNIFILVQAFQREETQPGQNLEQKIGYVVGKVAPSMLLSSISMSSCFFIGTLTEMPAVRLFALYAGVALLMNFFLQMTCFLGLFILDSRRQEGHRLDVCCCIRISKKDSAVKSSLKEGLMYKTIKNVYSPFLMKNSVRYFVMVVFVAWLCSSAAVLDKIEVGFDQKLSVPEDSYMLSSELGRMAMVKNRTFIALQPISWLDNYFEYLQAETCCYEFRSNKTHCPSYVASQNRGLCRSCQVKDPSSLSEAEFIRMLQFFPC
ncbi:NPC intracellular cholesterol transporter 1 [Caerostris extrusa]|uniref:NPC intracellular cholesterol transporter 1 n=1 Tax=Caerostris extrusa TaxID=172846 RepID=A0AAV4RAU4_CAEEX|nr:NPC intracellular cholesterol transporter 1 [Caerostris extrusa]